ncbi:peptide chain release factor N(5)-glutamine methyltransferase [Rhodanobacter sp. T12-5]|uniref:peptide chain release factor N(5)-glutamine methyltransferase n=1 Tax=Rhodanobacter sp. T12-5 TaxID=2024611 RepID=UPI0011EEB504|nr:peptide chain release factor N(5)-glutamine methyltransferase [Rhodanobacter sp. T12-5]KAA0071152.1 peptide chain release factor N(5)-glutamine methyltransferase [Rhodanobacter sp. T12-5]
MPDVRSVLADAVMRLGERADAELLLLHVLQQQRGWLFTHADDVLDMDVQTAFAALVARREKGEPVAYLTGRRGFWTLDLEVSPATLIPRPETELLVELALQRLPPVTVCSVADLGTGSGAIALAIARERPRAQVIATDASAAALAVAQRNAQRHAIGNVAFVHGDWLAPLAGQYFDLIVSNPPYIEAADPHLTQGDLRHEPANALASGPDGLDDIRRIVRDARTHLHPGGWLLFEHGWNQGAAARALLAESGYTEVFTAKDLESRDRVSGASYFARLNS